MKKSLEVGTLMSGAIFSLPLELVTRTLAVLGIRGSGKTVAATVIAEEMCEAGLPWVALDPVGIWWGLRANPDGTPGGYPVVVIGGQHGDLPLDPAGGRKVAEAILQENVSCILDLKLESKNNWRRFVAEFCDRLMELTPAVPRHVFIEEAPEFVPQRPMGEQRRSRAAVDRLVRLGRNQGYGATLISQRFATVDKDVLTQCENLLALRSIGKHDRDAARDWIAEVVGSTDSEKKAVKFFDSLALLKSGQGWFWSPEWLKHFVEIRIRRRKTLHPGETRTVGQEPVQVQLSDVREFVDRFRRSLERSTSAPAPTGRRTLAFAPPAPVVQHPEEEAGRLRAENAELRQKLGRALAVIANVRKQLEPRYRAMQSLFADLDAEKGAPGNGAALDSWKEKLGSRCAQMIDALVERGSLSRIQLATLTGQSPNSSTYANNLSKLKSNGLIEKDGGLIRLRPL